MKIDVALLPSQLGSAASSVCIVVDVLRASSSIVTLLDRGVREVIPAAGLDYAREISERFPHHMLCGERRGLPPPGFDGGNSPSEFSILETDGRGAILTTSNGTRLLTSLPEAPCVLVGCLLNRTAVAEAALHLARAHHLDIAVVSSAHRGSVFVLEDALGAGAIAEAAISLGSELDVTDSARFAQQAFLGARADLARAVASSTHARELVDSGLGADVAYCAQLDISRTVPALGLHDGVLVVRGLEG